MKKIVFTLSVFVAWIAVCAVYSCSADNNEYEPTEHGVSVEEYEQVRARLYDAALNLLVDVKLADNGDWLDIDERERDIIDNWKAPSLEVLLNAIDQLEKRPYKCLADTYDWPLCEYDDALRAYKEITRIK